MSVFQVPPISIGNLKNTKDIKEYLWDLNKKIRFLSQTVDEDNFTPEEYQKFYQNGKQAAELSYSVDSFKIEVENYEDDITARLKQSAETIQLLVSKGDVTNQINISSEKIHISGYHLNVKSTNFTLDTSGNLMMNGTINASSGNFGNYRIAADSSGNPYVLDSNGSITAADLSGTDIVVNKKLEMKTDRDIDGCIIDMSKCNVTTSRKTYLGWFYSNDVTVHDDVYCNCAHITGQVVCNKRIYCYDVWSTNEGIAWSDLRLKKDIHRINPREALEYLLKLRPVSYHIRGQEDDMPHYGLIAQEVLDAGDKYHIVTEDEGFYGIRYKGLDAVIAAAMQYQQKEMEELHVPV